MFWGNGNGSTSAIITKECGINSADHAEARIILNLAGKTYKKLSTWLLVANILHIHELIFTFFRVAGEYAVKFKMFFFTNRYI